MPTVLVIKSLVDRFGLVTVAAVAGVSPSTVSVLYKTDEMPSHDRPRRQLESAAAANANARHRQELRFVP